MSNENLAKCKFCDKTFRKESTLAVHACQAKRRFTEQSERGVQLGFQAYIRFFEMTQGSAKLKSNDDFRCSPYYNAFVSFGRHMYDIQAVNPRAFTEWVVRSNTKLDNWTHDGLYNTYLFQYLKKENSQDALERGLRVAQTWADENNDNFSQFFRKVAPNVICNNIVNGRISPWVVFNCVSGQDFLANLNTEQIEIIFNWIDPTVWDRKFKDHAADTEWAKHVLGVAAM